MSNPNPKEPDMDKSSAFLESDPSAFLKESDPLTEALDLSTIPACDLGAHEFCLVLPSPAIQAYLDADDDFDQKTVNIMEETLEKHYKLPKGFYITADRVESDGRLRVKSFTLMRET